MAQYGLRVTPGRSCSTPACLTTPAALRDLHPGARLACLELDRRRIESNEAMVAENYLWHERCGFDEPDEEGRVELKAMCGGDAPIDEGLRGVRRSGSRPVADRGTASPATRSGISASGTRAAVRRSRSTLCSSAASTRAPDSF
jgi:hypothetical protein